MQKQNRTPAGAARHLVLTFLLHFDFLLPASARPRLFLQQNPFAFRIKH